MKINFLGDSITQGAGASSAEKTYVAQVGKLLDATVKNYGLGGTRIARLKTPSEHPEYDEDFLLRAEKMDRDADFVFVFGGTNDYGHGTDILGDEKSRDVYTFCGAINTLIDYLQEVYGKEKIAFILPLHRYREDDHHGEFGVQSLRPPLKEYIRAEKNVLEKRGIAFLDVGDEFSIPQKNTGDDLTIDGLHPNDVGHALLARKIAEYVVNTKK